VPGFYRGKTGTLRCSICSINYPSLRRFAACPVCGIPTDLFRNLEVDEDWLDLAVTMAKVIDGDIPEAPET